MRRVGRGALFSAVALTALLAFGATQASAVVNLCASAKKKCVSKKMAGLLGCHGKCEKDVSKCGTVLTDCLNKNIAKFDGGTKGFAGSCFGKVEAKYPGGCLTTGDLAALEAKVDAFVLDVVQELDPAYPPPHQNGCSVSKKKCVTNKAKGLLGCHIAAEKDPAKAGAVLTTCLNKNIAKFDGGTKGVEASCFGKAEAKFPGGCLTVGDLAALEAKVDAFVNDVVCELDPSEGTCPTGTCPTKVTFLGTSTAGVLDAGWTGQSHDSKTVSEGLLTMSVGTCAHAAPNCGVCPYTGPIENGAGEIDSHRCSCDSSIPCNAASDCPGSCACGFYFGSYLPLSAGGVSTCVANVFNGGVSGTFNEDTGDTDGSAAVIATVYSGPTADNPCPKCVGDGALNDGVQNGTCSTGARAGLGCDAMGTSPIPQFGSTSLDCPPPALGKIADLPIDLSNTTGTKTKTLSASNPLCRATGFTTLHCFCDTCDNLAATPCDDNADCVAVGATVCGGKRCQGGANNGAACAANSACPGGACGVPGLATAPNQCDDATCVATTGNEGECSGGPFEQFCGPTAEFQSCTDNTPCLPYGETCSIGKFRRCYTDNGVNGNTVKATGLADAPVGHQSDPTLAALFCVGPTSSGAVNAVAGLPGLGRLELPGHATDNGTP